MSTQNKTTLKSYFQTGDKPTQAQFEDFIDSYLNQLDDRITTSVSSIANLKLEDPASYQDGAILIVTAGDGVPRLYRANSTSTKDADGQYVVAPTSGTGNWEIVYYPQKEKYQKPSVDFLTQKLKPYQPNLQRWYKYGAPYVAHKPAPAFYRNILTREHTGSQAIATWKDLSGNSDAVTAYGIAADKGDFGVQFTDGIGSKIDSSLIGNETQFHISLVFSGDFFRNSDNTGAILDYNDSGNVISFAVYNNFNSDNEILVVVRDDSATSNQTSITADPRNINVLDISIDENNEKNIWLNGVLEDNATIGNLTSPDATDAFVFGVERDDTSNDWEGHLKEVLVYNTILTDEQRIKNNEYLWQSNYPEIDFWLIAGQSNAEGRGDAPSSTDTPLHTAFEYQSDDTLVYLNDPVGGATDGSAWPAFANQFWTDTKRIGIFLEQAEGGSAMHEDADTGSGNWRPYTTGSLWDGSVTQTIDALNDLRSLGYNINFKGILWSQGERDAQAIDSATITKAQYKNAFDDMIASYKEVFGDTEWAFYMSQTGTLNTGDTSGFQDIRAAQEELADEYDIVHLAFTGAVDFPGESKMSDSLHYNQTGYNEMGSEMAKYVSRVEEGIVS